MNNPYDGRESRRWWYVGDSWIQKTTGYSCAPNNPNAWWCPEVGFSCIEGISLFATEDEAKKKLISVIEGRITKDQEDLKKLTS